MGINVLKCGGRKKLLKHLVGIGKGSTFAIPNDEGVKMRGGGKKRVEQCGVSRGGGDDL